MKRLWVDKQCEYFKSTFLSQTTSSFKSFAFISNFAIISIIIIVIKTKVF